MTDDPKPSNKRFARVQAARLMKALRLAHAAIELGEMKAVATYLRVAAAVDRFHELAAGPPPRPSAKAPPLAPPIPPEALTYAAPPASDELSAADEAIRAANEVSR